MGPASTVMERNQYTAWFRVGVKAVGRTAVPQHAMEVFRRWPWPKVPKCASFRGRRCMGQRAMLTP
jgi:hypothetical protein